METGVVNTSRNKWVLFVEQHEIDTFPGGQFSNISYRSQKIAPLFDLAQSFGAQIFHAGALGLVSGTA